MTQYIIHVVYINTQGVSSLLTLAIVLFWGKPLYVYHSNVLVTTTPVNLIICPLISNNKY